jgi:chitin synthase
VNLAISHCLAEYEAEAWETGSRHSEESYRTGLTKPRSRIPSGRDSPRSYQQASQSGDYYRDTNAMSTHNFRNQPSHSNGSQNPGQISMSQYGGVPQLPVMPLGGGFNGSPAGSEYGGHMPVPTLPYQNTGSMYGMPPMMTGLNMFGGPLTGGGMSASQSAAGTIPPSVGVGQRPLSTFSLATTVNPFAGPSQNPDPSDEELFQALRNYLSTQDLMTVTKK